MNLKDIVIVGTGGYYRKYADWFDDYNIMAIFDNAQEKQNTVLDQKVIQPVERIQMYDFDFAVVLVAAYDSVVQQLIKLGVTEDKIVVCDPETKFSQFRKVHSLYETNNKQQDVLLISHEMNMRGAPLMLYELALILREQNISCEIATTQSGEMLEYYKRAGINVLDFGNFDFADDEITKYFGNYKLVVLNTLALSRLAYRMQYLDTNVVWWLHEEWRAYDLLKPDKNYKWDGRKFSIYGVGKRAAQAFYDYYGTNKIVEGFQWGIKNECVEKENPKEEKDKLIFAIIGGVEYIKGQDQLVEVSKQLAKDTRDKIEFWVIGSIDSENREKLSEVPEVRVLGEIAHDQLAKLYGRFDAVLSLSRNDTMPVVLVEGMMNKKVIMTSTGTGISDYIENHVNGIVFETENIEQICGEIEWLLENPNSWNVLCENAYELYTTTFSKECFEEQIEEKIIAKIG